ncbi:hypothetical protein P691DRAFT_758159 [Macrolepiota fuliginosa MF-IS2]|uniref:Uncharacterized protein n=1 Tax=Macrolepiota fuliginosa MF-IS2 TaxID=1400762 RepID=A0A9P5XHM9_9AGAR|nr:hypothetical protein P691DRAFT_758159 [Macrolepiota fuliginosa MF-IS2]
MPPYPKNPVVDAHNPCYCPSLPARAYIHNLHQDMARSSLPDPFGLGLTRPLRVQISHFTRTLARTVNSPGIDPGDKGVQDSDSDTSGSNSGSDTSTNTVGSRSLGSASDESSSVGKEFYSARSHQRGRALTTSAAHVYTQGSQTGTGTGILTSGHTGNVSFDSNHLPALGRFNGLRDSHLLARPPRKRKEPHPAPDSEDSDIRGPSKYAKSLPATEEKSFEVRLKRETLDFNLPSSRHVDVDLASSSPASSLSSLELVDIKLPTLAEIQLGLQLDELVRFVGEVREAAPGIRIPMNTRTSQAAVEYLAENGLLTIRLMRVIGKYPSISKLWLSPSLHENNGLNLGRVPELLPELHVPGLFTGLISLSCDRISLKDDDVMHLHNLFLRNLSLCYTGISNAAVFLLVSHRQTLLRLLISGNMDIDDRAVPAFTTFEQLEYLKIEVTRISIQGLRDYARHVYQKRTVHIDVPENCKLYLDNMRYRYFIEIQPPLISDYELVGSLSLVELRKNLAAHAAVDKTIITTGNKADMGERLSRLLKQRMDDMRVKEMLEGSAPKASIVGDEGGQRAEGSEDEDKEEDSDTPVNHRVKIEAHFNRYWIAWGGNLSTDDPLGAPAAGGAFASDNHSGMGSLAANDGARPSPPSKPQAVPTGYLSCSVTPDYIDSHFEHASSPSHHHHSDDHVDYDLPPSSPLASLSDPSYSQSYAHSFQTPPPLPPSLPSFSQPQSEPQETSKESLPRSKPVTKKVPKSQQWYKNDEYLRKKIGILEGTDVSLWALPDPSPG